MEELGVCFICKADVLDNGKQDALHFACHHKEHVYCHDNRRNSETAGCVRCRQKGVGSDTVAMGEALAVFSDLNASLLNGAWDSWSRKKASGVVERLDTRIDTGPVGSSEPVEYLPVPVSALANSAHVKDRSRNAQFAHASVRAETLRRLVELCDGRASVEELKEAGYAYSDMKELMASATDGKLLFKNWRSGANLTPGELVDLGATWADLVDCGLTAQNIRELLVSVDIYTKAPLSVTYKNVLADLCGHTWKRFFGIGYTGKELRRLHFTPAVAADPENGMSLNEFALMRPMGIVEVVNKWGLNSDTIARMHSLRSVELTEMRDPESVPAFKYYFCMHIMRWTKPDCLKVLKFNFSSSARK